MKRLSFLFSFMIFLAAANGQRNYEEAVAQGDAAFKKGQFKLAIDKYFAAEAFDPSKKEIVNAKVKLTFDRIESLRQEAIKLKKEADALLIKTQTQTELAIESGKKAEAAKLFAEKQTERARESEDSAIVLRARAEKNLSDYQKLKETAIGARYKGGKVISWKDPSGDSGVIAAEIDLGEFSWKEAKDTCDKLVLNGFDDWRLPDRTELMVMYGLINVVGGFTKSYYWSSTTAGFMKSHAWNVLFNSGFPSGKGKKNKFFVRPVRNFKKS